MRPSFQQLSFADEQCSFAVYKIESPTFGFHWHYHPELELTYIQHGEGIRLVADNAGEFCDQDLVFLGANLPHAWMSSDTYHQKGKPVSAIGIHIPQHLLREGLLHLPEMRAVHRLVKRSVRGLKFSGAVVTEIARDLDQLLRVKHFDQLHLLLRILHTLGTSDAVEALASPVYTPALSKESENNLSRIYQYIHEHYNKTILLSEVAQLVNMPDTSFCRFFKKMTGKPLMEYVNDLRISKACDLLAQSDKSISEIAYISGFNSQTFFNRCFRKRKSMTPKLYRRQFAEER